MSSIARRRLWVLLTVQMLIIAHVVVWALSQHYGWFGGYTISPIEPSESIETVSEGIINAGAIFFAAALLSTAVLGRWFCGWGCHVLLLQDGCTWLLKKAKIRPRAFRSRLLMLAPLMLALYMFVWPLFYRFIWAPLTGIDLEWPGFTSHILVRDFWATFPGVAVAIVFLGVCGVLTVFMLGSKGFCTYGCPYGGFFAPLDRVAPVRVRVNDNCQGCGECTAVCTSNVRVHEEVASHGMVVDSGCMKTMDCIEACPNDALSIGLGPVAGVSKRSRRSWDLTWPQEIVMGLGMLALLLIWRGAFGVIPLLMAMGIAACGIWLLWRCVTMFGSANAKWLKMQLKLGGRLRPGGVLLIGVGAAFVAVSVMTALVQGAALRSGWALTPVSARAALAAGPIEGQMRSDAQIALARLGPTRSLGDGGLALWESSRDRYERVKLLAMLGEVETAAAQMELVTSEARPRELPWRDAFALRDATGDPQETQAWAEAVLIEYPDWGHLRGDVVKWLARTGRTSDALVMAGQRMSVEDARRIMLRAMELLNEGRAIEALPLMQEYVDAMPTDVLARSALARLLLMLGQHEQAVAQMQRAVDDRGSLPPQQQAALARELEAFNAMMREE